MNQVKVFFARPVVRSAVRHAALAAVGVFAAAIAIGGFPAVTVAVVAAAAGAGARVLLEAATVALSD